MPQSYTLLHPKKSQKEPKTAKFSHHPKPPKKAPNPYSKRLGAVLKWWRRGELKGCGGLCLLGLQRVGWLYPLFTHSAFLQHQREITLVVAL
jgi:hypothetical protein